MPENITDVDAFTDPVQAPLDGEFATNASLKLFVQPLANRSRNAKNRLDTIFSKVTDLVLGIGSDYASLKTTLQNASFAWAGLHTYPQGNVSFTGGAQARLVAVPLGGFHVSQAYVNKVEFVPANGVYTNDNGVVNVILPLQLRHGLTITSVTAHFVRSTTSGTMELHIERVTPGTAGNPNTVTSLVSLTKTSSAAEILTSSTIAEAVDPQSSYHLRFEPPSGGDRLYWAYLNCTRQYPLLGA